MQVLNLHAQFQQVIGKVLCHALGQRGYQYPFALFHPLLNFSDQVIHLPL